MMMWAFPKNKAIFKNYLPMKSFKGLMKKIIQITTTGVIKKNSFSSCLILINKFKS